MAIEQREELSLPEEKIFSREFEGNMEAYRMRRIQLRSNNCFVYLRFHDFRGGRRG